MRKNLKFGYQLVPTSKREMYLSETQNISYIKHMTVPTIKIQNPLKLVPFGTALYMGVKS
jgi:hypothetical protein